MLNNKLLSRFLNASPLRAVYHFTVSLVCLCCVLKNWFFILFKAQRPGETPVMSAGEKKRAVEGDEEEKP